MPAHGIERALDLVADTKADALVRPRAEERAGLKTFADHPCRQVPFAARSPCQ